MIFNLIVFFIIPWLLGTVLYYKDGRIFLTFFCFFSMLAFTANTIGVYLGLWNIYPYDKSFFSFIPLNLGLYPIAGVLFIYMIHNVKINNFIILLTFTIFSTIIEWLMGLSDKAAYGNGWNIYYTCITFLISYYLGYLFYITLKKKKIMT